MNDALHALRKQHGHCSVCHFVTHKTNNNLNAKKQCLPLAVMASPFSMLPANGVGTNQNCGEVALFGGTSEIAWHKNVQNSVHSLTVS